MQEQVQNSQDFDAREEYRTIEAALLETARGRWFLSEHGRRARRLDSALLEDAIGKLQNSIRQPPALLGQLQGEVEAIRSQLDTTRSELLERASKAADKAQAEKAKGATDATADTAEGSTKAALLAKAPAAGDAQPMDHMLKAAEDIHELAWGLQAEDINPDACEAMARQASALYALSMHQSAYSNRILNLADALDAASERIEGILQTIGHELQIDGAEREVDANPPVDVEPAPVAAAAPAAQAAPAITPVPAAAPGPNPAPMASSPATLAPSSLAPSTLDESAEASPEAVVPAPPPLPGKGD